MTMTYYAMLLTPENVETCLYEGPFLSEDDASDYVDSRNEMLQDAGYPALWSVV